MLKSISARLPEELAHRLDDVARETDRPRSYIIQKALEYYLEEMADIQVALDRLYDKSDPAVSGKELRKALGI